MFDIHCERLIEMKQLIEAMSEIFSVSVSDIGPLSYEGPSRKIMYEICQRGGEFKMTLTIYNPPSVALTHQDLAKDLARRFDMRCLISDDEINPYSWILVDPAGDTTGVFVEAPCLDDRGDFVVERSKRG